MPDSPAEVAGISGLIAGVVTGIAEVLRSRRQKKLESDEPPKRGKKSHGPPPQQFQAIAAHVGSISQKIHDLEARMDRWSKQLDGISDSVDELVVKHAIASAETRKDLEHLREQVHELKDRLKQEGKQQ